MVYGCGNQLIKFLVFIANFLIFVFGALILGFSLWANLDQNFATHLKELAESVQLSTDFVNDLAQYQSSLWILCAVSLILLTLFFIILMVLSAIQLFTLIFTFANRGELLNNINKVLIKSSETEEGRRNLLPIETALRCCGATSQTAYLYNPDYCPVELRSASDCYTVISNRLETMGEMVVVLAIILLVIEAFR
uniref:Tetraspanin n=1 Tax=Ditylenchus dipsaci TaxID=166011 RepID=A0A915DF27_9BILA